MGKNNTISISAELYEKLSEYCKLNNCSIKEFAEKSIDKALTIEMYGNTPFTKYERYVDMGDEKGDMTSIMIYDNKDKQVVRTFVEKITDTKEIPDKIQEVIDEMLENDKEKASTQEKEEITEQQTPKVTTIRRPKRKLK